MQGPDSIVARLVLRRRRQLQGASIAAGKLSTPSLRTISSAFSPSGRPASARAVAHAASCSMMSRADGIYSRKNSDRRVPSSFM